MEVNTKNNEGVDLVVLKNMLDKVDKEKRKFRVKYYLTHPFQALMFLLSSVVAWFTGNKKSDTFKYCTKNDNKLLPDKTNNLEPRHLLEVPADYYENLPVDDSELGWSGVGVEDLPGKVVIPDGYVNKPEFVVEVEGPVLSTKVKKEKSAPKKKKVVKKKEKVKNVKRK